MKPPDEDCVRESDDSLDSFMDSPIFRLNRTPDSLEEATIDSRYVIEKELSHTTMSHVYLARDLRRQQQRVVIKILSETLVEDAEARQRFERELKTLLHLDDQPNIVSVQDSGELPDGRPYLVMPYIDGETLRSQMAANVGMDFERASAILKQIGAALNYIHENDVFHRDLKPENIMLKRGTDSVVMIDFGIAKLRNSTIAPNAITTTLAGTLAYMSPEQLTHKPLTAASDVYSMGVVAYEMLTGRRPFNPESPGELLDLQRAGVSVRPMQLRTHLSRKADRIITRALSFEPKARYKSAGEFADKLAEALLDEPAPPVRFPIWTKLTGGFVILALLTFGIVKYGIPIVHPPSPTRSFTYWLTVQKMRDGKEYQPPFQSNGEETFENGDKFRLNLSSTTTAYLYVFNQRPPDAGDTSFFMLYPNTSMAGGLPNVGVNQPIQLDWITFRSVAGDENFWMIWSVNPISELEPARIEALKHPGGGLTGESLAAVKEYLRLNQAEFKTTIYHYKNSQTAVPRGKTDTLIALAQFKHR